MALEQNVTRIEGAKQDLKSAIEEKGVSVPSTMKIDGYADLVRNIKNQSNISSVDKSINVITSVDGDVDLAVNTEIIATNDSVDEKVAKYYTKIQSDKIFVSNLTSEDDSVKLTRTTSGYDLSIGEVNGVTFGYLINGSFYTQNEENEEYKIEPQMERLYVDILTNDSYEYTTVKKEDVEVKTLLNGKFGNISNAKVGNYAYYKDFYPSEYNIKNDEIIYQIDKEFIEDTFTNFIPKGTHILNFSDITYLLTKYNISNINEETDKFVNALTKDFDFKFTTIDVGVDKIEGSNFWVVLDEESKEELGINDDVMLFNIYHPSTSSYMINSYPYIYEDLTDETIGSLYYVLDSYTSQPIVDKDLKCLDVPYEGVVSFAEMLENVYQMQVLKGGENLCYPLSVIDDVLPQGTHIITSNELFEFILDRYPDFYTMEIDSNEYYEAIYNTLIDIGIEETICNDNSVIILQFYMYNDYKLLAMVFQKMGDMYMFNSMAGLPSPIYYLNGEIEKPEPIDEVYVYDAPYEGAKPLDEVMHDVWDYDDVKLISDDDALLYPSSAISKIPSNAHLINDDEITMCALERYPDLYESGDFDKAIYDTLVDIGVKPIEFYYERYGQEYIYKTICILFQNGGSVYYETLWLSYNEHDSSYFLTYYDMNGYGQIYYAYDNAKSSNGTKSNRMVSLQSVEDQPSDGEEPSDELFINKYVKVSDTKVQNGQFINEMFMDKNNNKLDLINDKLYFDNEKKITYVYENGEFIPLGGGDDKYALKKYYGDDAINLETHTTDNSGNAWFKGNVVASKSNKISYNSDVGKIAENNFIGGEYIKFSGQNMGNLVLNSNMNHYYGQYKNRPIEMNIVQDSIVIGEGSVVTNTNNAFMHGVCNTAISSTHPHIQGDLNYLERSDSNIIIGSLNSACNMVDPQQELYLHYFIEGDLAEPSAVVCAAEYNATANRCNYYNEYGWRPCQNLILGNSNGIARGVQNIIVGQGNVSNTEILNANKKYINSANGAKSNIVLGDGNDISLYTKSLIIGNYNGYIPTYYEGYFGQPNKAMNCIVMGSGHSTNGYMNNTMLIGVSASIMEGKCVNESILIASHSSYNTTRPNKYGSITNSIVVGVGVSANGIDKNIIFGVGDKVNDSNTLMVVNETDKISAGNNISASNCSIIFGSKNTIKQTNYSLVLGRWNKLDNASNVIANNGNYIESADNCILFNNDDGADKDYEKTSAYNHYSNSNSIISLGRNTNTKNASYIFNFGEANIVSSNSIINFGGSKDYYSNEANTIKNLGNSLIMGDNMYTLSGYSIVNIGHANYVKGLNYSYTNGSYNQIMADLLNVTSNNNQGIESNDGYEILGSNNNLWIGIESGKTTDIRTSIRLQGNDNTIGSMNSAWGYIDIFGMKNSANGINDNLHICGNSNSASATKDVTAFGHSMNLCDISSTFVVDTNGNKFSSNKDGAYVNKVDTTTTNSGYSIVNINYIQSLVDRIVALENALKANGINI